MCVNFHINLPRSNILHKASISFPFHCSVNTSTHTLLQTLSPSQKKQDASFDPHPAMASGQHIHSKHYKPFLCSQHPGCNGGVSTSNVQCDLGESFRELRMKRLLFTG
jgi:hypothetical protein